MSGSSRRPGLAALLATALALSCGGDGTGPVAGTLSVRLVTPTPGQDAAVLFTLSGPAAFTSASAPAGLRVFHEAFGPSGTRFVVTGALAAGTILTIGVADVSQASSYAVSIQQIAGGDYALRPLTGYALTVTR